MTLNAASDNSENATVSKPELLGMGSNHIVILELEKPEEGQEVQPIRVNCFDEILYVGDGVTVVGKRVQMCRWQKVMESLYSNEIGK